MYYYYYDLCWLVGVLAGWLAGSISRRHLREEEPEEGEAFSLSKQLSLSLSPDSIYKHKRALLVCSLAYFFLFFSLSLG